MPSPAPGSMPRSASAEAHAHAELASRASTVDSDDDTEAIVQGLCERLDELEKEQESASRAIQEHFRKQQGEIAAIRRFVMNEGIKSACKKKRKYASRNSLSLPQPSLASSSPAAIANGDRNILDQAAPPRTTVKDPPVAKTLEEAPAETPKAPEADGDVAMEEASREAIPAPQLEEPVPKPITEQHTGLPHSTSPAVAPVARMANPAAEKQPKRVPTALYSGPPRGNKKKRGLGGGRAPSGRQSLSGNVTEQNASESEARAAPKGSSPPKRSSVKARRASVRTQGADRDHAQAAKPSSPAQKALSAFTPVNKPPVTAGSSKSKVAPDDIPSKPQLFTPEALKATFGSGKAGTIVKISDKGLEAQYVECQYYVNISADQHTNPPKGIRDEGAMLDVEGIETINEIDRTSTFPLLLKKGKMFLYCGDYTFGETTIVDVDEWKSFSPEIQKHWARKATPTAGGNERLRTLLNKKGILEISETRNIDTKEILGYFNEADTGENLRISSTELLPVSFNRPTYDQLCKQQEALYGSDTDEATAAISSKKPAPSAAKRSVETTSVRKRMRIEEQPADYDDGEDAFAPTPTQNRSSMNHRAKRQSTGKNPQYDLVALSHQPGLDSSQESEEEGKEEDSRVESSDTDVIPARKEQKAPSAAGNRPAKVPVVAKPTMIDMTSDAYDTDNSSGDKP